MLTYEQTFEGTFSFVKYAVDTVQGVKTAIKCIPVSGKEDEERSWNNREGEGKKKREREIKRGKKRYR